MALFLWMSGALASFCILAIGARELSGDLSIAQSLCIRSAIGILFLSCIYYIRSRYFIKIKLNSAPSLKTTSKQEQTNILKLHLFRNIFHFIAQYGWFFGIGLLPLAEVFALEFTVPIWTMFIAALFLKEKVTKNKLLSISLGMVGVLIIVRPGYAIFDYASLVVLGSAVFFAISHTATKSLGITQSPFKILFLMCGTQFPLGLILCINDWIWPVYEQWLWLTVIGLSALSAHFCLAKAMTYAEVTTIITIDFLRLPIIALIGVLFYRETFELPLLIGGGVMLAANLIGMRDYNKSSAT